MSKNNYVDNKKFYEAFVARKIKVDAALLAGEDVPRIDDYIGKCIYDICTHLSYKPNFINYSYRSEMISDALENCVVAVDKFDSEKYDNPFAYFTQIAFWAFLRRIEAEQKQQYLKFKLLEELPVDEMIETVDANTGDSHYKPAIDFMRDHSYFNTKDYEDKRNAKKKTKTPIESILESDEE